MAAVSASILLRLFLHERDAACANFANDLIIALGYQNVSHTTATIISLVYPKTKT